MATYSSAFTRRLSEHFFDGLQTVFRDQSLPGVIANAISLPLLSAGFIILKPGQGGVLLSPGTEGVFHSLLMGAIGLGLYFYRKREDGNLSGDPVL